MTTALSHVELQRTDDGRVRVQWTLVGPPAEVTVAVGASPALARAAAPTTVAAATTSLDLSAPVGEPIFVALRVGSRAPRVVGERLIGLEGLQNFRDLGGYPTIDGGHTQWGRLFRADSLHKLTDADHRVLDQLAVRSVFDLRGDQERETHPNPRESLQLAIVGRPPDETGANGRDGSIFAAIDDGERLLRDIYIGMLVHSAPLFGRLVGALADDSAFPAVFHCHAGKDRTGVVAALVLLAVGVSGDDVLDDYELTRLYRRLDNSQDSFRNMIERGLSPEAAAGVLSTPRWAMVDALTALDADHGGVQTYLTGPAGLSAAQLDALRHNLVERPSAL